MISYSEGAQLGELGFSLKPPKFIRKAATAVKKAVTLKNVLKAGAIVGAAVVAGPAALAVAKAAAPIVARGAIGLARGAGGVVRGAEKGVTSIFRSPLAPGSKNNPATSPVSSALQRQIDAIARGQGATANTGVQRRGAPSAPGMEVGPDSPIVSQIQTALANATGNPPAPGTTTAARRRRMAGRMPATDTPASSSSTTPSPQAPPTAPMPAQQVDGDGNPTSPSPAGFSASSLMPVALGIGGLLLLTSLSKKGSRS